MNHSYSQKVLLMGKSGVGKTSMRSIIFSKHVAKDTRLLDPTVDVDRSHVCFLGKLPLSIWDCGGQTGFSTDHIELNKNKIFQNAIVLVYLFDIQSSNMEEDKKHFKRCLTMLHAENPKAVTFCLLHKMDLVPKEDRERVFEERKTVLTEVADGFFIPFFGTSIWDESLYTTWSHIVSKLIPNIALFEKNVAMLAQVLKCDEVVLLEKNTLLTVTRHRNPSSEFSDVFEKMNHLLKYFKVSCSKMKAKFNSVEFQYKNVFVSIQEFTNNTFLMVTYTDSPISTEIVRVSVKEARAQFIQFENIYQESQNLRTNHGDITFSCSYLYSIQIHNFCYLTDHRQDFLKTT